MDWHWQFLGLKPDATAAEINRAYRRYFTRLISAFGMAMEDAHEPPSSTTSTLEASTPPGPMPLSRSTGNSSPRGPGTGGWAAATILAMLVSGWGGYHLNKSSETHSPSPKPENQNPPASPDSPDQNQEGTKKPDNPNPGANTAPSTTPAHSAPICIPRDFKPRILASPNCYDLEFNLTAATGTAWSFIVDDAIVSHDTLFYRGHLRNSHGVAQEGNVFIVSDDWERDIEGINAMIQDRLNRNHHGHAGS
jgi:hypothetical protein